MRMPFRSCHALPARSPSSPFGKGSKAQKAGTRDAGPSGPAARLAAQSSVQLPAGIERKRGLYGLPMKRQGAPQQTSPAVKHALGSPARLDRADVGVS